VVNVVIVVISVVVVFVHQFRSLREQLLQKAQADYTDDDIFEMVS
jgi:hypothetical protein